jgi:hypothetical protein
MKMSSVAFINSDYKMVDELLANGKTLPNRSVERSIEKLEERGFEVHFEPSTGYIVLDSKWKDVEMLALHWAGIDRLDNIKPGDLNIRELEDRFTYNYLWRKYWNLEERYMVLDFFVDVYKAEAKRLWQKEVD